jgi:hypothetical protein
MTSKLARVVVALLLAVAACNVAVALVWALVWWRSWDFVYGLAAGVGLTVLAARHELGRQTRHLRELLDWVGEDLAARKAAELRRVMNGLP